MLKRYKIADGWAEMKETDSEDGRWVKWADLQAYFGREDVEAIDQFVLGPKEGRNYESGMKLLLIAQRIAALLPESS